MNKIVFTCILAAVLFSCSSSQEEQREDVRFRLVSAVESGLNFKNQLQPDENWNIIDYLYYYNGAGVSVGDINNDGLPDLFFTGNEVDNRLFLNQGDLKFRDITGESSILPGGWSTGSTMADVNGDGWLDIYVCQVGRYRGRKERNQLFINNQDGTFTEMAAEYGLDFSGLSTQAAFFDYDLDGDLDMYLLNHSVHSVNSYGPATIRQEKDPMAGDRLFRNDLATGGVFTDVTRNAGIFSSQIGYGLGLAITDYNNDGLPDIYVSNDFHENDYLYRNLGNGKFAEVGEQVLGHTSRYSMGNETGDLNGDGNIDLVTLDMLPGDPSILRKSAAEDRIEVSEIKANYGYGPQFVRNALQINSGHEAFSDLGVMAGMYATDWSWGALIFDMEYDGKPDLYITNGIVRRPNDLDYIQYLAFTSRKSLDPSDKEMTSRMPGLKIPNVAFHNQGNISFADSTTAYGLNVPSFSNGAVYSDLDRDGDLDIVVNNINDDVFLWENTGPAGNYLEIEVRPGSSNHFGVGSRIELYAAGQIQVREIFTTRGFMSSVEPLAYFGLGDASKADSIVVYWPGNERQKILNADLNRRLTIVPENTEKNIRNKTNTPLLTTSSFNVDWQHKENSYRDYKREPLIPYELSMEGPAAAVGDVNGDGRDDIFVGGAHGQASVLFLQETGGFSKTIPAVFTGDAEFEDVAAEFLDVDLDGDLDLYVVSGGNEYAEGSEMLSDRLYINRNGTFDRASRVLLPERLNGSTVSINDLNGDGFPDAFIGVRSVPGSYGTFATSYLLINNGNGELIRDESFSVEGMITDAAWFDADNDGDQDLCVVGDWSPIRIFLNENGTLTDEPYEVSGTRGWWRSVAAVDLDNDGDDDLIAGNAGLNMKLKTSVEKPVELYLNDIDGNGQPDPVIFYWLEGQQIPFASKDELDKQVPVFKKQFSSYQAYADADDLPQVIRQMNPEGGIVRRVDTFASVWLENAGNGTFSVSLLPGETQWSPVQDIFVGKRQVKGGVPVILGANSYAMNIAIGRMDAMPGSLLLFDENGGPELTGNFLENGIQGDFRVVKPVMVNGEEQILLVRNNGEAELMNVNNNR